MPGIFNLSTAAGLREKLRRDLEKLKAEPVNEDNAFNFFVTAEHMLDWVYPNKVNKNKRTATRKNSILLQVCSHLANGAKHFETEASHHDSVSATGESGGYFPEGYFPASYFPRGYFGRGRLFVNLKGDAATQFGQSIGVLDLAEQLMDYWDRHPLV